MNIPRLSDDGHHLRAGLDQSLDVFVILGQRSCPTGASEGSHFRMRKGNRFDLLKKLEILWIGARPSSFDVMNSQFIQLLGNPDLILDRKRNVFCLRTIAEGGVVKFYRIGMNQSKISLIKR